jgi:peptide chain release factor 2
MRSGTPFDLPARKAQLDGLNRRMAAPDFWANPEAAQKVIGELKTVKAVVDPLESLATDLGDAEAMLELADEADDEPTRREAVAAIRALGSKLEKVELASLLSGENDARPCFFSIQAGAGGTEACDWAAMLLRMYTRYFDRNGYKYQQLELREGEQAGIQSVTMKVTGPFAYGTLSCEAGVHRLVRSASCRSSRTPRSKSARRTSSWSSSAPRAPAAST